MEDRNSVSDSEWFSLLGKALGFVKNVNTNTFLFQGKNYCLKVTLIWILTIQHLNTQNVITEEGYNFLGTHF